MMASTSTERSGAITWVSSIRTTMANDPGRQLLEDQIQTSGFLFLEDYMESILSGPKYDPIIELVKTPARRKDAPKKTRAATAAAIKANAIMTMDLNDEDFDKENEIPAVKSTPINTFHKALLQSTGGSSFNPEEPTVKDVHRSAGSAHSSKPPSSKKPNSKSKAMAISTAEPEHILTDEGDDEAEEDLVEKLVTPPRTRTLPLQDHEIIPPEPIFHSTQVDQPQAEINAELSVIAEDDEPAEGSQSSIVKPSAEEKTLSKRSSGSSSSRNSKNSKPYHKKDPFKIDMMTVMDIDDFTQTTNFTIASSNSAQSFQTVPLDSPPPKPTTDEGVTSRPQSPKPRTSMLHEDDFTTAPLPEAEAVSEATSKEQPIQTTIAHKPNISPFTIGPPSPLRKSMRVPREHSLAANHALPVAKPAATRSSWLVKAREAKAMEDNAKKLAAMPTFSHHIAGNKRKSGEMLDTEPDNILDQDAIGRTQKSTKITPSSPAMSTLKEHTFDRFRDETAAIIDEDLNEDLPTGDGADMINKLKKTVAGFSARANKSMGKSLGGAAATALAEARAAAEAKIAERNAAEGRVMPPATASPIEKQDEPKAPSPVPVFAPPAEPRRSEQVRKSSETDRRLSVSDLVSKPQTKKGLEHERVFQPPPQEQPKSTQPSANDGIGAANTSTSTTPPNSPPPKMRPPIFTLPEKPKLPPMPTFFPPPVSQAFTRVEPQPFLPQRAALPLSSQSTLYSTQSTYPESIFDNEMPPWVPSTQDTDLSDHIQSQNLLFKGNHRDVTEPETDIDADESWHLDDKFGEAFTPVVVGMKEDSMTWSTMPTRSTRSGDTGTLDESVPPPRLKPSPAQDLLEAKKAAFDVIPSDNPPYTTDEEEDMDVEYDEDVASVRLVTPSTRSHESGFSTQPSKLQPYGGDNASLNNTGGFFSSASKLVSSVLGGSKKGKEPVKSLQLAAAAAKKQQEEADKKAARLKEMEARRQQVMQKKVDEEKTREEKKAKEESEKRKREREKEDTTEKRALKLPGKKLTQLEDDLTKKRKLAEPEKKPEAKKPSNLTTSKIGKLVPTGSQSGPSSSAIPAKSVKQTTVSMAQSSTVKVTNSTAVKGKGKAPDFAFKSQSQAPQSQMQARYQAQLEDSRKVEIPPPVPTESIELPDINSEYSDSDDENRVRTFDPPNWAQSPALREALTTQSTVNPDDIFGAIRPLKMEELFKNRTSRFRARTSSANWAGTDELTAHEEREYVRRMGYKR